jgi:hypothetical protein
MFTDEHTSSYIGVQGMFSCHTGTFQRVYRNIHVKHVERMMKTFVDLLTEAHSRKGNAPLQSLLAVHSLRVDTVEANQKTDSS